MSDDPILCHFCDLRAIYMGARHAAEHFHIPASSPQLAPSYIFLPLCAGHAAGWNEHDTDAPVFMIGERVNL